MHSYLSIRDQFLFFNGKIHLTVHLSNWFVWLNLNVVLLHLVPSSIDNLFLAILSVFCDITYRIQVLKTILLLSSIDVCILHSTSPSIGPPDIAMIAFHAAEW